MKKRVTIIGAGPAGLACAWHLLTNDKKKQFSVSVFEKESQVGGLAKTLVFKGYRFDIGGHRFYTKYPQVQKIYDSLLGSHMLVRKRLSRIYYRGIYFKYPLEIADVLKKIGFPHATKMLISYINRQFHRHRTEDNFTHWVENRFGDELFNVFFKSYTEKVWGVPTEQLSAKWAQQRIQNFSLPKAALNAFFKNNPFGVRTIISRFLYPKKGPGMFYEVLAQKIKKAGGNVLLSSEVTGIETAGKSVQALFVKHKGTKRNIPIDSLVSTMPLTNLLHFLAPSKQTRSVTDRLSFRSFLTVNCIVAGNPFPDNWIYIHDPSVRVGRIQNFFNWSPHMSRNARYVPISLEYFCTENDAYWNKKDKELITIALQEAKVLGLFDKKDVKHAFVHRVEDAYPVYNLDYEKPLKIALSYLQSFKNLSIAGRGGLFRYNNMDHSIFTGINVANAIISGGSVNSSSLIDDNRYLEI